VVVPQHVRNNEALQRFELATDAGVAFASYRLAPGKIAIFHTEVPRILRGRGIGTQLARQVLEEVRRQQLKLIPECSFIRAFVEARPEFRDLLTSPPGGQRA
jgi:predicted GNAT family acetyltransferase